MKRSIKLEAFYPHPAERVWRAITDSEALAKWLMPNDFEPRVGHKFNFRTKPAPGFDGIVHCEVLRLEEPRHLAISWRGGSLDTEVTFTLEPATNGTKLLLEQSGFNGLKAIAISLMLEKGWKKMFANSLPATIESLDNPAGIGSDRAECSLETA